MRARTLAIAVVAALTLIAGCSADEPRDERVPSSAAVTTRTSRPGDEAIIRAYVEQFPAASAADPTDILSIADQVCDLLDTGTTVAELAGAIMLGDALAETTTTMILAVEHQCPEHEAAVTGYLK